MAWTPPNDPVSATIITVAYAVANLLTQIRWLRLMTGNADPPGTGYVVTSDSVAGTSWKTGVAAITGVLGYAPVNKTGDTMSGVLAAPGFQAGASGVNGGVGGVNGGAGGVTAGAGGYNGGSLSVGVPSVLGLGVGASGLSATGAGGVNVFGGGGVTVSGGGGYNGGSTSVGTIAALGVSVGATGLSVTGTGGALVSGTGGVNVIGGPVQGGVKTAGGDLAVIGLNVGAHGIASDAAISCTSITPTSYAGGTRTAGIPSFLGALVGTSGISSQGPLAIGNPTPVTVIDAARNITPATYGGGTKLSGVIQVKGLLVGTDGLAVDHQITSNLLHPTPPMVLSSQGKVINLHADILDGAHASTAPSAGAIPIADAGGTLDDWVTPSAGSVPAGVGGWWSGVAATIPAGWTRATALNGRVPVGAGTTFGQTFVEGTPYGTAWSHSHTQPAHAHAAASLGVGGTTGGPSSTGTGGGTGASFADGSHTHVSGGLDVSGSTDGATPTTDATTWLIPMFAVVWIVKS
jgi:hypothetical protein